VNDILKQRLVGALILIALGVVFWPIIFVEPGQRAAMEPGRIPPPPVVDSTPIASPSQEGLQESQEWRQVDEAPYEETVFASEPTEQPTSDASDSAKAEAAPVETSPTRESAPAKPVLDDKGVPVAWTLQVATVSSKAKADELRDSLLGMGEKAYVKKLSRGGKDLYRVSIGPNFERAKLEKVQGGINSRFGVKSLIVRYAP